MKTRRLIIPKQTTSINIDEEDGFIPLATLRIKDDDQPPSYRSITQSVRPSDIHSSNESSSSDDGLNSAEEDLDTTDVYTAETSRLSQILSSDLSDVPAWLDVISHTASLNPTPQGRAEIWVTMLEKAMASHPSNSQSVTLRLRYIEAIRDANGIGPGFQDAEKDADGRMVRDREVEAWESALTDIVSEDLWVEYVSYNLASKGVEEIEEAVGRVWKIIGRASGSDWNAQRRYYAYLRVFWRTIIGLKEAGKSYN